MISKKAVALLGLMALAPCSTVNATTDADSPMLGEMKWVAFNFAPRGWAFCDGQLLPIAQHQALFSLYGTQYGGDGRTTFALPDLRSRAVISTGSNPQGSTYSNGMKVGAENVTITSTEIPSHSHALVGSSDAAESGVVHNGTVADTGRKRAYSLGNPSTNMDNGVIQNNGGGQAHNNMGPSLALNCIVALQGIFPSRN